MLSGIYPSCWLRRKAVGIQGFISTNVVMGQNLVLGVDIGGSHITSAIVDLGKNAIVPVTKSRMELNSKGSLEEILSVWSKAIRRSCDKFGKMPEYMGVSMPGPLDYAKGISLIRGQDKYDALYKLNVKELLASGTGLHPDRIGFINDAAAFLQGEILGGAAKGAKNVIGITLGTGLGSAKGFYKKEVEDADLWKMPFKESIAEEYLSTRWCVNRFFDKTSVKINNVRELFIRAKSNSIEALEVFSEFGLNLGLFLTEFIALGGDIDTVVLGGSIANASRLFIGEVNSVLSRLGNIKVRQATLGEEAALIGAAGIWKDTLTGQDD